MAKRVLIFGGTGEARDLAALLLAGGYDVTTSLAGITSAPAKLEGQLVRGGFGGAEGIAAYVAAQNIAAIVDATHPFAARISYHAHAAASDCGIPYLRLERPPWVAQPDDGWTEVAGTEAAVAGIPSDARVMLTVGHKAAAAFLGRLDIEGVVRMIEAPDCDFPEGWLLIRERPPFSIEHETMLLGKHGITILVTKNSGGGQTYAKLVAARALRLPVIVIARPQKPDAPRFATPAALAVALRAALDP